MPGTTSAVSRDSIDLEIDELDPHASALSGSTNGTSVTQALGVLAGRVDLAVRLAVLRVALLDPAVDDPEVRQHGLEVVEQAR